MKSILIATIIIALLFLIITSMLEKTIKNKSKGKVYIILYYFMFYSSVVTLILSVSYFYTDTIFDFIRVSGLFLALVIILELQDRYMEKKRYNWIVFSIVIFIIYGCYILALRYMLCGYSMNLVLGATGGIIGSYLNKPVINRKKVIISAVLSTIIIAAISLSFRTELFKFSKPIRIAIDKAETEGYHIDENDYINVMLTERNRFEEIHISIIRIKDKSKIERDIQLEYYKEKVTMKEFQ